jgi:adenine-specific DNA-methyltransferase
MDWSEDKLIAAALLLGAREVRGWTMDEERLTHGLPPLRPTVVDKLRREILRGNDPLGEIFCSLRPPAQRREHGATYPPLKIVQAMIAWAQAYGTPSRVVDPGMGSARFILEAGRRFRQASLIGSEIDPVAAILARGNIAAAGLAQRAEVVLTDFRNLRLPEIEGRTLYTGNPPYVRHHLIPAEWKEWLVREAAGYDLQASQLAGLHIHFFLSTVLKAKPGDFGSFITAAEWLDVNYGSLLRDLFLGALGGQKIVVIEPTAMPFPDAITTAAITSFEVGSRPRSVKLKRIASLDELRTANGGRAIRRERLEAERRWSHFTRAARTEKEGYVELGELCRVHRGQVTGANKVWIAGQHSEVLPASVLFPSVTKARELIRAGLVLQDPSNLRRVIDLPVDLDVFDGAERRAVDRFLRVARRLGAADSYIAQNRKAWWSVGLRQPAPILATYMARRPPAFVRNLADARHINIAHGLYPREPLTEGMLTALVTYLATATNVGDGRTYAGGLTKFEPREMERIFVPTPQLLGSLVL